MGETDRLAILSIQEEIRRDRARERELRERRKQSDQAPHQAPHQVGNIRSDDKKGGN